MIRNAYHFCFVLFFIILNSIYLTTVCLTTYLPIYSSDLVLVLVVPLPPVRAAAYDLVSRCDSGMLPSKIPSKSPFIFIKNSILYFSGVCERMVVPT